MEWIFIGGLCFWIAFFLAFPSWRKWEIERERRRNPKTAPVGALVAPFDEVFHPHAYVANLEWQAQQEVPAPAPDSDGSRPDLASGRIRISLDK